MAQIKFSGGGATGFTYTFESDEQLTAALVAFSECIADGDDGLWLGTSDGVLWLPTGTPLLAEYDNTPPDNLIDILVAAGTEDEDTAGASDK